MNISKLHRGKLILVKPRSAPSGSNMDRTLQRRAISSEVVFVPKTLTLDKFINRKGKGLVVAAYCLKPFNCPEGRFSVGCRPNCNLCHVSTIQKESQQVDLDFIITINHESFFNFLKNNEGKYKRLIAIACPYTVGKIADTVHLTFGLSGLVLLLRGNVCTSKDRYIKGAGGKQKNQTKINLGIFLEVMKRIKQSRTQSIIHVH